MPKWQQFEMEPFEGRLVIDTWDHEDMRRTMRRSRLVDEHNKDIIEPLHDSAVIHYRDNIMRINGFQKSDKLPAQYMLQSWHIEVVAVYYNTGDAMRHKFVQEHGRSFDSMLPPHKRGPDQKI